MNDFFSDVCIHDDYHMLPVMTAVNYMFFLAWCVDTNTLFHALALGFNFSFYSVFLFQYEYPSRMPEGPVNHMLMHIALLLFFMYFFVAVGDAITLNCVLLLLGPIWNSARIHGSSLFHTEPDGWAMVSATFSCFIVSLLVLYRLRHSRLIRYIELQLIWSFVATLATSALLFQGGLASEFNGDVKFCPFVFPSYSWIVFAVLFIIRVIGRRKIQCRKRKDKTERERQRKKKTQRNKRAKEGEEEEEVNPLLVII